MAKAKPEKKTLAKFEETHGQPKIKELEKQLSVERTKVEALAESTDSVSVETSDDCRLLFALTGDRHTGSLYHNPVALNAFYDYAIDERGVKTVFDAGDILDGHRVYRGQEFELRDLGLDAQIERLKKDGPRKGKTRFITGNHDGAFKSLAGVSVGKAIEAAMPSYEFLGEEQASVEWTTPNGVFTLGLIHPGGGSAYALSYKPQKIIESLEGGTKPDMLGVGHFHKAEMLPSYRNVCGIQVGTFQRQTPFMARCGLMANVGGWIVEVTVGEGHNVIRGEFVAFYV